MGLVSLCASKGAFSRISTAKRIHVKFLNFSTEMIRLSHNGKDLLIASPLTYPFL